MRDYQDNSQLFSSGLSRHPTIAYGEADIGDSKSTLCHLRLKSKEVRYMCAENGRHCLVRRTISEIL